MSKDLKKLPIGIQTFSKFINKKCLYIDKTKHAIDIVENYNYIFLSRLRRFGKSLFIDTLQNMFEGNRELFKNLYAYDNWDWDTKYPVIKISWANELARLRELLKKKRNNRLNMPLKY